MKVHYPNPFQGKPAEIPLSGLFLFHPEVALKLDGLSSRRILDVIGWESPLKCLERFKSLGRPPTKKLLAELRKMASQAPMGDDLLAALAGDDTLRDKWNAVGDWETFQLGMISRSKGQPGDAQVEFLVEVEKRSGLPLALFEQQRFEDCAQTLGADPVLSRFVGTGALAQIAGAPSVNALGVLRERVAMEVWLSATAALDLQYSANVSIEPGAPVLGERLLGSAGDERTPTRRFFACLMACMGVTSIPAFEKRLDLNLDNNSIGAARLKKWSCGKEHPSRSALERICSAFDAPQSRKMAMSLDALCRNLNFLGCRAQSVFRHLGHASFEDWARSRYAVWLAYHRHRKDRSAEGGDAEAAPRFTATS